MLPGREAKSIGTEETLAADLRTAAACDRELVRLSDRVGSRLRQAGCDARTITVKIRFADFETRTRARTLDTATDATAVILATARELLVEFNVARGVRLLGVSCAQLDTGREEQTTLFLDDEAGEKQEHIERRAAVERAVDSVRSRFGSRAVNIATLVEREEQP